MFIGPFFRTGLLRLLVKGPKGKGPLSTYGCQG